MPFQKNPNISDASLGSEVRRDESYKERNAFSAIPGDVIASIASYVNSPGVLRRIKRDWNEALRLDHLGPHFLRHVHLYLRGNLELDQLRHKSIAEKMIIENPDLIRYRGNITDTDKLSKTQYKKVNALELLLAFPSNESFDFAAYMLSLINDTNIEPEAFQTGALRSLCSFLVQSIVMGNQKVTLFLLEKFPMLLEIQGSITDSAGRVFNCSVYEYGYWSKDTHMRRLLEMKMTPGTKAKMRERCMRINEEGLNYHQHGIPRNSNCFDFKQIMDLMSRYVGVYQHADTTKGLSDEDASRVKALLEEIGFAQHDLPMHVINEYCRTDREFFPTPKFNEKELPRTSQFVIEPLINARCDYYEIKQIDSMFPVFFRGRRTYAGVTYDQFVTQTVTHEVLSIDLEAIKVLDEIRTRELALSLITLEEKSSEDLADELFKAILSASDNAEYEKSYNRVVAILHEHPELIRYRRDVPDSKGQVLKNISAFELALMLPEPIALAGGILGSYEACPVQELYSKYELLSIFIVKFLAECVIRGEQNTAESILKKFPILLRDTFGFTDLSSRTFNCSPYEYAYWAQDTHMCRMMERYMDPETKAMMLKRCQKIESTGLDYLENNIKMRSTHFYLVDLIRALDRYLRFKIEIENDNFLHFDDLSEAWKNLGAEQKKLPMHVRNEYCRLDRSFEPTPQFDEIQLPRTRSISSYLPGAPSTTTPPDLAICRGNYPYAIRTSADVPDSRTIALDLNAMKQLAQVRRVGCDVSLGILDDGSAPETSPLYRR